MKIINKLLACMSLLIAGLVMCSTAAYASVAGHVQFVSGDVQVVNSAGQSRQVQKGEAVSEGDTLTSASASSAQIKMQDGGFIAVRPDTKMKFDQFAFTGKQDGSERGFFSLFKGGFRAVTGLIGRVNKQNYRINTPAATIGIRGTDHETIVVVPGSPLAAIAPAGAYNKVNVGETTLTTDRGTISVLPNQMGYAGGMDQLPKLQPVNANLFTAATESKARGRAEGNAAHESAGAGTTDAFGNALRPNLAQQPFDPLSVAPNLSAIPLPAQGQGAVVYFDAATGGTAVVQDGDTVNFVSDRLGMNLTGFSSTTPGGLAGSRGAAMVMDAGRVPLNGGTETMGWGRWAGDGATVIPADSVPIPVFDLHFVGGNSVGLMPTANPAGVASVNYVAVGGTTPTGSDGNFGQFTGATVGVNFATQKIDVTINMNYGGIAYTAADPNGTYSTNGVIPKTPFVTVTDSSNIGGATGAYSGAFIGRNAAGLGLVYQITHGGVDVTGAQGFVRR